MEDKKDNLSNIKDIDDLDVVPQKTAKSDLPQSEYMKDKIIGKFPSMMLVIGRSGSGKSTVVAHMCTKKKFFAGFFHKVYMFSPTGKQDDLVKCLKLPEKNIFTKPTEEKLTAIINDQNKLIEKKGIKWTGQNSRVMIIFDDIVSNKSFLSSPAMLKLATMGRHSLISSVINTQSYTKVPRAIRLQANAIILFPSNQQEVDLLVNDHCPPKRSKKEFRMLVDHATKENRDFLHILPSEPIESRFRKCFKTALVFGNA